MQGRLRLLLGATALLYLGPLLAGLAGQGWSAVPVFVAIFVLWLILMRPWVWPRDLAAWAAPQVWVAAAAQVALQVLVVALCFGIGRGLGGVLGVLPLLHPLLPAALSFLSLPLSRLIWNPETGRAIDSFLDEAIHQIENPAARPPSVAEQAVAPLLDLPEDADPQATLDLLRQTLIGPQAGLWLDDIVVELDQMVPPRSALRRAVIVWGTDPAVARTLHGTPGRAFLVAGHDPDMLRLFTSRALPMITADPGLWTAFPDPSDLAHAMDGDHPEDLNDALEAIMDVLNRAMPPDPPAD